MGERLFLSRLCGGEAPLYYTNPRMVFLSRLCGGEVECRLLALRLVFLSRLCGGEDAIATNAPTPPFSKPPMWR